MPVQAVIDLLIPGQTPGIKERIVDLYGKPEILFFGPDGKHYCELGVVLFLTLAEQRALRISWIGQLVSFCVQICNVHRMLTPTYSTRSRPGS